MYVNSPRPVSLFGFYFTSFFYEIVLTACEDHKSTVGNYTDQILNTTNEAQGDQILFLNRLLYLH